MVKCPRDLIPLMVHCHDMQMNEIYECKNCGLELKVVKTCQDSDDSCGCSDDAGFTCCGAALVKKA